VDHGRFIDHVCKLDIETRSSVQLDPLLAVRLHQSEHACCLAVDLDRAAGNSEPERWRGGRGLRQGAEGADDGSRADGGGPGHDRCEKTTSVHGSLLMWPASAGKLIGASFGRWSATQCAIGSFRSDQLRGGPWEGWTEMPADWVSIGNA